MKAPRRFINGRWLLLIDELNPEYVERSLNQSHMWSPEHRAEMVEVNVTEVSNGLATSSGEGAAVLGLHPIARGPGEAESVMAAGTVSAPIHEVP